MHLRSTAAADRPTRLAVHRADRKAQVSQPTRCAVPALDQGMGTRVVQAPWLATAPQSGAAQQAAWLRPLLGTGGAFHDRPGSGRSSARSKSRSGRKLPAGERLCPPLLAAENSRSMASAPVVSTSRSSRRSTTSVVRLELQPARRAISSTGTPEPGLRLIAGRRGVPYSGRSDNDILSVKLVFLRRPAGLQVARASTP